MNIKSFDPADLNPALWDQVPAAITILDLDGTILLYNAYAPRILDRKPEYIGRDVCELHKSASAEKIRAMLDSYLHGGSQEFSWQLKREGKEYVIRLAPLRIGDSITGAVHIAMLLP
jgi:PAS domain S-box-containing protein